MKTNRIAQRTLPIFCAAWLLGAAPGFVQAEEGTAADVPAAALRKGDALLVRIEGLGGGLPEYREIIDSAGRIELPFIGFFAADGKTAAALEAEMAGAYANARLATNATVHITFVTHFEPPPERATLIRVQDPRRPAPAPAAPAPP